MPEDEKTQFEQALERSADTDQQVLLAVKEKAKRTMLDEPTPRNVDAFRKASAALDGARAKKEGGAPLKSLKEVLEYLSAAGRKAGKSKVYDDIQRGRLKKQANGTFLTKDVDKYLLSLPFSGTPEGLTEKVADRQRRKEEAEIRRAEAVAAREEYDLDVRRGKFLPRDQIQLELAARAVALRNGLKTGAEFHAAELISACGGDPAKTSAFLAAFFRILDEALGEYASPVNLEITFEDEI